LKQNEARKTTEKYSAYLQKRKGNGKKGLIKN